MIVKLEIPATSENFELARGRKSRYQRFGNGYRTVGGKILFEANVDSNEFANAVANSEEGKFDLYSLPSFFGLDPDKFREEECVATPCYNIEVCHDWGVEGKRFTAVTWAGIKGHFFFREIEGVNVPVPCAPGWSFCWDQDNLLVFARHHKDDLSIHDGEVLFPWIALYPEAFAGMIPLLKLLTPDEKNPLTGLLTAKDGPTRVCAKQVANNLSGRVEAWALEIISHL